MKIQGPHIFDDSGRTLLLRGCNLGGSSKLPSAPVEAAGQNAHSLENPAEVSFVGRPFPLEEAEERFDQLRSWGFTFIRFVLTWESLEHAGPGIYDESYLAYLRKLLIIAEKKGISVFMDPHQDSWSRWTGGDGAPAWTLEKLGMDLSRLDETGAAITRQHYEEVRRKPYPRMIWPVNYNRYAAFTLFTLFFAGNAYAPDLKIEGQSAQDWLQEHYFAAFRHCYRRLKNCKALAGWGAMNEPHPGLIGYKNLENLENIVVAFGAMPSAFEAMKAASGYAVKVPVCAPWIKGYIKKGSETINPKGLSLFKEGYACPWKQAGIWTDEGCPKLLKKDHFALYKGKPADFVEDFLKPFIVNFIDRMKEADRPSLFFIEGVNNGRHPTWSAADGEGVVNAFHHYDGPTLFLKSFHPGFTADQFTGKIILGRKKVAALYAQQLKAAKDWTKAQMGNMPSLLGEFGLPFDMNNRRGYKTGDYSLHEEALSLYYDGIDKNLLHSTIWNYTADSTPEEGDRWNGEDLSIISGGKPRALNGWRRPYPMATAGMPLSIGWDRKTRCFSYRFTADPKIEAPTEIFIPLECFGTDVEIATTLKHEYKGEEGRLYIYNEGFEGEAEVSVRPGALKG
ncbi:glycoside hydrolase family 5 protein [Leadbettera azotonutricia]|uniref:Negative regulator of the PHO system n=1 Tax=Leadbettera azotonutricia (strain ATCC BAA-888 / DSM 13862 / ZAS-9) TaxID=545695 RepID=F5YCD0_LEAAZ|nr:cellulase family glycosylhydrolase [Leadbettera azotonutricia]AEF81891.1 negative regulator of the PHO system [Leadbettera azotonutricia ZAS-9]